MSEELYDKAKAKVEKKKAFYYHLAAFVPCMMFIAGISIFLTPHVWWWFLMPLFGWGIALFFHYIETFGLPGGNVFTEDWEAQEIEKEIRKLQYEEEQKSYWSKDHSSAEEEENLDLRVVEKRHEDRDFV